MCTDRRNIIGEESLRSFNVKHLGGEQEPERKLRVASVVTGKQRKCQRKVTGAASDSVINYLETAVLQRSSTAPGPPRL